MTRIVCISDTHARTKNLVLPEGDILVSAGDITNNGDITDIVKFAEWVESFGFKHAITIAGNHDWCFANYQKENARKILEDHGVTYLLDESVTFEGLNFYGSPWQPWFYDWAFNVERGKLLEVIWAMIPDDTNVLITHGPPYTILDGVADFPVWEGAPITDRVGCADLLNRVKQLRDLKLHVFGHLHYEGGLDTVISGTRFVNASICDDSYSPCRKPVVVDLC